MDTAPVEAAAAMQQVPAGWQVLHCGVARGVLYVTYVADGRAAITPAVPNAAVARACAAAGHALGASAPQRTPAVPAAAAPRRSGDAGRPAPPPGRNPPSFTPQALGASLAIDARNDGDMAWRCSLSFGYAADIAGSSAPARYYSGHVTLAPRQALRAAQVSVGSGTARFVGTPGWLCNALE